MRNLLLIIVFTLINVNASFSNNDTIQCYNHLGKAWEFKYSNPKNSFKHIDSAMFIAEKMKSDDLLAKSLYYKAMINYLQGNYGETFKYVEESKKYYLKQDDSYGIASLHNLMGLAYQNIGAYEDAILSYELSLVEANKTDNLYAKSNPIHNIGLLYGLMNKPEQAIENYKKALIIRKEIPDTLLIGQSFQAIGASFSEMMQMDSSIFYSKKALKWISSMKEPSVADVALTQNNLAVAYSGKGDLEAAHHVLNLSMKLARSVESFNILTKALINKADNYLKQGELKSALEWSDSSLFYAKEYNDVVSIKQSLLIKKRIFEEKGNYKIALEFQIQHNLIEDSLNTSNYANQLSILNVKNRVNEYNEKITKQKLMLAQQQINITKQQLEVKQRNYLLLGLTLLVLFIFAISFFIYKQQKLKQQKLVEENRLKDQINAITVQNELHEERLRISRDLHDNIGSQLTFIISSVDSMKHLFKSADEKLNNKLTDVSGFTRTTITQLRDTIWALNKDEISFEDLKSRLFNYIENANLAQEQTEFIFNSTVKTEAHLNSIEGVNIYRVVQEAINNSMKYAAATKVVLDISENEDEIELKIADDGIGFNLSEIQLGNGLDNMRSRAAAIKADFTIDSSPEKGTVIKLILNKNTLNAVYKS